MFAMSHFSITPHSGSSDDRGESAKRPAPSILAQSGRAAETHITALPAGVRLTPPRSLIFSRAPVNVRFLFASWVSRVWPRNET